MTTAYPGEDGQTPEAPKKFPVSLFSVLVIMRNNNKKKCNFFSLLFNVYLETSPNRKQGLYVS